MRRLVVVLDTNVSATGLMGFHHIPQVREHSASVLCLIAAVQGEIVLKTSASLIAELERVFQYPWFGQPLTTARKYVRFLRRYTHLVNTPGSLHILTRDPDDNMVLECAIVGRADCLVTWNTRDFTEVGVERYGIRKYRGVEILTPPKLLQRLLDDGWVP